MKPPHHLLAICLAALAATGVASTSFVSCSPTPDKEEVKTVALTNADFDEKTASGVVLVDFWAEWCVPCHMIAPTLEELAAEYEGKVLVAKVDVDSESELAERFNIEALPTLKILKDGKLVDEVVGIAPKKDIAEKLDALVK